MEQNEVTVSEITQRITTTHVELASIAAMLEALPEKKEAVLGAPDFDEKTLLKIEEEESKLLRKKDYLEKRIPLLEKQAHEEQARLAQARINSLADESAGCVAAYEEVLTAFNSATENLRLASEALVHGYLRALSLHDEQVYLLELHEDAHLIPTVLASAGPLPDGETISDAVLRPLTDFWRRSGLSHAGHTPWSKKLVSLQDERHARQQDALKQTIPGHLRRTVA
jgi:hypothetical protein